MNPPKIVVSQKMETQTIELPANAPTCSYITRTGIQCEHKGRSNTPYGPRCPKHIAASSKVKCSFQECPFWTASRMGCCSTHWSRRISKPAPKPIIVGDGKCDMVSFKGAKCGSIAISGCTRCSKHVGNPARSNCLKPGCTSWTNSKSGLCSKHSRFSSVYSCAKTIAEAFFEENTMPYIVAMVKISKTRPFISSSDEKLTELVRRYIEKKYPDADPNAFVLPEIDEHSLYESEDSSSSSEHTPVTTPHSSPQPASSPEPSTPVEPQSPPELV